MSSVGQSFFGIECDVLRHILDLSYVENDIKRYFEFLLGEHILEKVCNLRNLSPNEENELLLTIAEHLTEFLDVLEPQMSSYSAANPRLLSRTYLAQKNAVNQFFYILCPDSSGLGYPFFANSNNRGVVFI